MLVDTHNLDNQVKHGWLAAVSKRALIGSIPSEVLLEKSDIWGTDRTSFQGDKLNLKSDDPPLNAEKGVGRRNWANTEALERAATTLV